MQDLVIFKNNEAVCSSLEVAEKFGKKHKHVLEKIEKIISEDSAEFSAQCFTLATYTDNSGKQNKMYIMNRDGFTFLAMGFTGKKANEWKWKYIKAFNTMEALLHEKSTQVWIETRKTGQITRHSETDVIKQLVEYAKEQGSGHANMLYVTYSKLANKAVGITSRNLATTAQLNQLTFVENIILNQIQIGMEQQQNYKVIYQNCKKQIELFKEIAYIKGE